jgi:hypothetical protein
VSTFSWTTKYILVTTEPERLLGGHYKYLKCIVLYIYTEYKYCIITRFHTSNPGQVSV